MWVRRFCSVAEETVAGAAKATGKPIVAAAVLERLPVYSRPLHPTVAKFKELSAKWKIMIGEIDVLENAIPDLHKGEAEKVAAPTATITDRKSLERALDDRLYLVVHGAPYNGNSATPVWHFPEQVYAKERNLRKCAETALKTCLGDLSEVYFAATSPNGHLVLPEYKRFYFRSHFVGNNCKFDTSKYRDYAWVNKDELVQYLNADEMELMHHMLPIF